MMAGAEEFIHLHKNVQHVAHFCVVVLLCFEFKALIMIDLNKLYMNEMRRKNQTPFGS